MKKVLSLLLTLVMICGLLPLHVFAVDDTADGPVIIQQPVDTEVPLGERIEVSVKAEGEGLQYQWYLRNASATKFTKSSVTGDIYDVKLTENRVGRQVYCVITDANGNSVKTDTVTLNCRAATKLTIVTQPKSVVVPKGEKARVSLKAEGDDLTYTWYFKNAGASSFKKTDSFTGKTYRVEMTDARAGRQVYCVVTDRYGNKVQSDTATLIMGNPAKITVQPESVTAERGQMAMVTFEAAGDGLTYAWYYKNAGASSFRKTTSFSGRIYQVEMEDSRAGRQVYCVVTDQYGNKVQTDTVTLMMKNQARITVQPKSVTVAEGEKVRVWCEATGDGLTYEWYIKNAGETTFRKSTSFTGDSYTTKMNDVRDGRHLFCKVTDQYGNVVATQVAIMSMLDENQTPPAAPEYADVCDKLSWETINAFPVASDAMSIEELRELCLDFFRFSKTFTWTPDEDYYFVANKSGTKEDSVLVGTVYGGLPYMHKGNGNVYRVMDFYDPETGLLDISAAAVNPRYMGSQCSMSTYWGWGRVINSARFGSTYDMVPSRGFIPLGEYTFDHSIPDFRSGLNTTKICKNNGEQVMYESYACLQPADGLVYYRTGGHVIMCSTAPVVVRNADGTINPDKSYIHFIDQTMTWKERKQSNGDPYYAKNNIDSRMTFTKLYEERYIPFTFAEFLGTDPVEELVWNFGYSKSNINAAKLERVNITANYGMSDVYVHVKDRTGSVVYTVAQRSEVASVTSTFLADVIELEAFEPYADGKHTIEVVAQFVNGQRETLYTGRLN